MTIEHSPTPRLTAEVIARAATGPAFESGPQHVPGDAGALPRARGGAR